MPEFQIGNIGQNPCSCNRRSKNHNISVENVASQNPPPQIENKGKQPEGNNEDSYSTLNGLVGSVKRIASDTVSQIVKQAVAEDGSTTHKAVGIAFKQDGGAFSTSAFPDLIGKVACKVKKISDTVSSMFNAFSPFINLINGATPTSDGPQSQEDKKVIVKDVTIALERAVRDVRENEELNKSMSPEAKKAISEFYLKIEKLSQRQDLKNMDISQLIAEWRRDPNSAVLLQMAQSIRQGQCAPFRNRRLQEAFIRSLESLGNALEGLENQPQNAQTQQAIQQFNQTVVSPVIENMHIHQQAGGDANYTQQQRIRIQGNFMESHNQVQGLINDPECSSCISDISEMLEEYSNFIFNSIKELFEERKEEEERDERIRCKKLCEERKNDEKLIRENCKKYWIKKSSVNVLSKKLEEMQLNMSFHNMLVNRVSKRAGVNRTNIESDARKSRLEYNNMEYRYRNEKELEYYYKDQLTEILNEISPSSECIELMVNTETKFHC